MNAGASAKSCSAQQQHSRQASVMMLARKQVPEMTLRRVAASRTLLATGPTTSSEEA